MASEPTPSTAPAELLPSQWDNTNCLSPPLIRIKLAERLKHFFSETFRNQEGKWSDAQLHQETRDLAHFDLFETRLTELQDRQPNQILLIVNGYARLSGVRSPQW